MIKALRIDHRLVHGQVAFTWTHFLSATRIIVIDDKVANDDFQKMTLNMAKPAGCKLNIFSVSKALERADKIDSLNDNVFIIFGNCKDAAGYIANHPKFKELNLGELLKKKVLKNMEMLFISLQMKKKTLERSRQQVVNCSCSSYQQQNVIL